MENQATQSIFDESSAKARRDAQIKKYGQDRPIYCLSMVALLDEYNIDPKYSEEIRNAVDRWMESFGYGHYSARTLKEDLLSICGDDNMKSMCHEIIVHAYHMEEAGACLV